MQLETKPHRWACLATSFAMALGITTKHFFHLAGHEGDEIVFPHLPEPQRRRGFHISEAVRVAMTLGFSASPIELMPRMAATWQFGDRPHEVMSYYAPEFTEAGNFAYFAKVIDKTRGVIECTTSSGAQHAVAYSQGIICDPDGRVFKYTREVCESHNLYTNRLWCIQKVIR